MNIRPFAEEDLTAVARLCGQELVLDRAAGTLPAVLMRRPRVAMVASLDDSLPIGACFGSAEGQDGFIDLILVDRAEQRRGVGRALMTEMERRLSSLGCENINLAGHGPYYAWPGVDIHYTAAICFAEDLGYQRCGISGASGFALTGWVGPTRSVR